jgi:two-component system chemotaxis response regulator CheY
MSRILVVDDAKIMRINIIKILQTLRHEIVGEAQNAYEAVQLYKKLHPDLVTMDITMPAKEGISDGIEAVKQIISYDKNAKIIMITSHGEEEKVIQAIQAGASNYILKPLDSNKLKNILAKLLG